MKKTFFIVVFFVLALTASGFSQDIITVENDQVKFTINSKDVVTIKSSGLVGPAGPVGSVVMWPTETVPEGYLECDGRAVSRTTYADLFAVLGEMYGSGDGSTTFNLPDLRGMFVRGYDHGAGNDPNAASRADRGDGTVGDHVGTRQDDEFFEHSHTINDPGHSHLMYTRNASLAITPGPNGAPVYNPGTGDSSSPSATGIVINKSGGSETRPKNISMMFIIKY